MKSAMGLWPCVLTRLALGAQSHSLWGRIGCTHAPHSVQDELVLPTAKALAHPHVYIQVFLLCYGKWSLKAQTVFLATYLYMRHPGSLLSWTTSIRSPLDCVSTKFRTDVQIGVNYSSNLPGQRRVHYIPLQSPSYAFNLCVKGLSASVNCPLPNTVIQKRTEIMWTPVAFLHFRTFLTLWTSWGANQKPAWREAGISE